MDCTILIKHQCVKRCKSKDEMEIDKMVGITSKSKMLQKRLWELFRSILIWMEQEKNGGGWTFNCLFYRFHHSLMVEIKIFSLSLLISCFPHSQIPSWVWEWENKRCVGGRNFHQKNPRFFFLFMKNLYNSIPVILNEIYFINMQTFHDENIKIGLFL